MFSEIVAREWSCVLDVQRDPEHDSMIGLMENSRRLEPVNTTSLDGFEYSKFIRSEYREHSDQIATLKQIRRETQRYRIYAWKVGPNVFSGKSKYRRLIAECMRSYALECDAAEQEALLIRLVVTVLLERFSSVYLSALIGLLHGRCSAGSLVVTLLGDVWTSTRV